MSNYSLVVFDIAGTTVRDKGNIAEAFIDAFKEFGISVPIEEVNKVMGWRKKDAIVLLLDKFQRDADMQSEELVEEIHTAFIQNMISFYENDKDLQPLGYAEELFQQLRANNIKVALNTGFTKDITDVILRKLNWREGQMIDFVVCSDEVPEGRPYPYMIRELMKRSEIIDAKQVVKVGDTEVDVQEGRNADCGLVISITTGAYSKELLEQYQPDEIIDHLSELPALML
ncbi:MAG: HAD-IA family hydrolase [Chitinophagaceae bacterium]|nr:HAD-IA family hydrolase [Chitinophagaceae bacterium]